MVPADDVARNMELKYACVRAVYPKGADRPTVRLVRTEPSRPDLVGGSS